MKYLLADVRLPFLLDLRQHEAVLLPFAVARGEGTDQSRSDQGRELHADPRELRWRLLRKED